MVCEAVFLWLSFLFVIVAMVLEESTNITMLFSQLLHKKAVESSIDGAVDELLYAIVP